ncbi:uncharacterized protein EDB91DRAFT_1079140 [Suillus paluster]|uniref:uncharacterized protein n=1 Tax=Suillus paluster TaxID=48578 RepID=UPI001B87EB02|nr:uncharacterized protein EDB91DRAFT_1079140 [Suillus paluster]KAG1749036.1 hypothetical protein EDB91DRAFT_1079140 [Suillus paluster]
MQTANSTVNFSLAVDIIAHQRHHTEWQQQAGSWMQFRMSSPTLETVMDNIKKFHQHLVAKQDRITQSMNLQFCIRDSYRLSGACQPKSYPKFSSTVSRTPATCRLCRGQHGAPILLTRLHMIEFNPSAVAHGIGKVTRKPTTTTIASDVEVVYDKVFHAYPWSIILDEERMVISTLKKTEYVFLKNSETDGVVFDM